MISAADIAPSSVATLTFGQMLLRLGCAVGAGAVIGVEREVRGRPAGLRTTMLTCVAAAVGAIFAAATFPEGASRVTQGVLTGMGFLGSGVIVRQGLNVRGLTTAAVLWLATILGATFGTGQFVLGWGALAMAMAILVALRWSEDWLPREWHGTLVVTVQMSGLSDAELRQRIESLHVRVKRICLEYDLDAKQRTIRCEVKHHRRHPFHVAEHVVHELSQCRGVVSINWSPD
jgi:putative Mg2+ transporter-C (MgtC) family protein